MIRYDHPNSQMAVKANTVLKVLKNSSDLSLLDILVRESIQNSLDASRNDKNGFIEFYFDIIDYSDHDDFCKSLSFLKQNENDPVFQRLIDRVKKSNASAIILSDKGTTGLSGPVEPNDPNWRDPNVRKNFANLVYELGQNHGAQMAGGSFGFGKSIYYRISDTGLVLYYSRSKEGDERLALCMISIDEQKTSDSSTGISWWGDTSEYKGIKYAIPVADSKKISEVLYSLKMERIRLSENETGTSICIIGPTLTFQRDDLTESDDIGDRLYNSELLREKFEEAVQKWYWPRMIETETVNQGGKIKPLKFFSCGKHIPVSTQNKEKGKLLKAAEDLNRGVSTSDSGIKTELLTHNRGGVRLGTLAYQIYKFNPGNVPGINTISMIRAPRMVVYEKDISGSNDCFFSAVFLVNSDEKVYRNNTDKQNNIKIFLDNAFRDSESSTHSEWNKQNISEEDLYLRYYVDKAIRDSVSIIENALQPLQEKSESQSEWSAYSGILGKVLLTEDDGFPTTTFGTSSSSGRTSKNKSRPKLLLKSQEFGSDDLITFCFSINNISKNLYSIHIKAKGGRESLCKSDWGKKIGNEFPFVLDSAESRSYEIKNQTEEYVQFMVVKDPTEADTISVNIKVIKKDAAIDFELYSFK